jgi:hypothetical protein
MAITPMQGLDGDELRRLFVSVRLKDIMISADTLTMADILTTTDLTLAERVFRLRETAEQTLGGGAVTATGAQSWLHELKDADELREFFVAVKMFGIGASNASLSAPLLQRHA